MRKIFDLDNNLRIKSYVDQCFHSIKTNNIKIKEAFKLASELFISMAKPKIILQEISIAEFKKIYDGEGFNHPDSPIGKIFPKASNLAVFACTIGMEITIKINELFEKQEYLLGCLLDEVASFTTDKVAEYCQDYYFSYLSSNNNRHQKIQALRYSPGYCGWHISSQKKLFEYLSPEEIGIYLNENYLMSPLKSISGVIIAGERKIHFFRPNFEFCKECKSFSCRERMKVVGGGRL